VAIRICRLVLEDTPAGLAAGRAAGAQVLRIAGTLTPPAEGPSIRGYDELAVSLLPEGIGLRLRA
jgi:sugar-phosphatase